MPPIFIVKMPTVQPQQQQQQQQEAAGNSGAPPAQRTINRPPWIKNGPEPLPMPSAPWALARARDRRISRDEPPAAPDPAPVRKQSKITIIPSQPSTENGVAEAKVKQEVVNAAAAKKQDQPRDRKIDIQVQSTKKEESPKQQNAAPRERKMDIQVESKQKKEEAPRERKVEVQRKPSVEQSGANQRKSSVEQTPASQRKPSVEQAPAANQRKPSVDTANQRKTSVDAVPASQRKSSSDMTPLQRKLSQTSIPPKPPAPPMPPPPPPGIIDKKPLTEEKAAKLEALRSRPRKRPDWGAMMKEVENGNKNLKHVQCNDRSSPLIPKIKVKDNFMYESEKPNVHNRLLKEIQGGIHLKRVKCNDRSKPNLEGLRKFRRQLTIEEQIQKAEVEPETAEPDELDDIDKVRDDLQSTKQMLALELRNKEAMERENKRLLARILNLEADLEKEKFMKQKTEGPTAQEKKSEAEKEVKKLKDELDDSHKQVKEMEEKYHEAASQLDMTKTDLEEERRKRIALERKLADIALDMPLTKQPSAKRLASMSNVNATMTGTGAGAGQENQEADEESEYEEYTESEEEEECSSEDEEKAAALREKRIQRELRLLNTKVYSLKEKEDNTRKERRALRMQLKNQQAALKAEKKKYKELQKEVDKMSKLMTEDEGEEEEEEDEEEETEESSEESEESSSEEEESEGDLPTEAPVEERKKNYMNRAKRHEGILSVLRKGNYLLKANVDKLKDDLFKQKEMSLALQEDLNSVLAELG